MLGDQLSKGHLYFIIRIVVRTPLGIAMGLSGGKGPGINDSDENAKVMLTTQVVLAPHIQAMDEHINLGIH